MPTPTRRKQTPSCGHTISPSSYDPARRSRGAAPCSSRCGTDKRSCFSISSWLCATTSTIFRPLRMFYFHADGRFSVLIGCFVGARLVAVATREQRTEKLEPISSCLNSQLHDQKNASLALSPHHGTPDPPRQTCLNDLMPPFLFSFSLFLLSLPFLEAIGDNRE